MTTKLLLRLIISRFALSLEHLQHPLQPQPLQLHPQQKPLGFVGMTATEQFLGEALEPSTRAPQTHQEMDIFMLHIYIIHMTGGLDKVDML